MAERHSSKISLSLLGLVIVFVVAFGLDQSIYALRRYAEASFNYSPLFVLMTLGNLVLAGCLIALGWYVDFRGEHSRVVVSLFLIIGGLVALYSMVFALFNPAGNAPDLFRNAFVQLTPDTRLCFAAAFVTMIGVVGLTRRR